MKKIYENKIAQIGQFVEKFSAEKIMLFFNEQTVMTELKSYSYMIAQKDVTGEIKADQVVILGNEQYSITAVGKLAQENLQKLGHVTFKFNGAKIAELPGTIYLEDKTVPLLKIGDEISIGISV